MQTRWVISLLLVLLAVSLLAGCGGSKPAQPAQQSAQRPEPAPGVGTPKLTEKVTLTAVSSFPRNAAEHLGFFAWVERVKKESGGMIEISYRGGPEVIPANQLAESVQSGAVDIGTLPQDYYPHIMPMGPGMKLSPFTPREERKNGILAYYQQVHREKLGVHFLGKTMAHTPFYFWSNKKIEKLDDFKGMKIRTSPVYVAMIRALGAEPVSIPVSDVYTALERKVVDGYGYAGIGPHIYGWDKVTKYEVLPALPYKAETVILVNGKKWDTLPEAAKKILTDTVAQIEVEIEDMYKKLNDEERAQRKAAGVQTIELPAAERDKFIKMAIDVAWAEVEGKAPQETAKLKQLFVKK